MLAIEAQNHAQEASNQGQPYSALVGLLRRKMPHQIQEVTSPELGVQTVTFIDSTQLTISPTGFQTVDPSSTPAQPPAPPELFFNDPVDKRKASKPSFPSKKT